MIAIHSMPRSGSTWLGSIIDSSPHISYKLQPFFSYALKGFLTSNSDLNKIEEFKRNLFHIKDDFLDQTEKKNRGVIPSFEKSDIVTVSYKETRYHYILKNLMETDEETILVGLIRNPLAMLNSWFHAPKEFEGSWKIEEEWREGSKKNNGNAEEYYGFDKWKEVTKLFLELKSKYPERVFIVNYGELLNDPLRITKELFLFIDLPYSTQTDNFLINSRNSNVEDPYGVFKTKQHDDAWKTSLPDFISEEVYKELHGTDLEQYLN